MVSKMKASSVLVAFLVAVALSGTPTTLRAEALEFTATYPSSWSIPLPKVPLTHKSIEAIESESQFVRIFGVRSKLDINWRENFLVLIYTGTRSNGGYGLSVDSVNLVHNGIRNSKKTKRSKSFNKISVTATETTPGQFCFTPSIITHSLAVIKVKRNRHLVSNRAKRVSADLDDYSVIQDSPCSF